MKLVFSAVALLALTAGSAHAGANQPFPPCLICGGDAPPFDPPPFVAPSPVPEPTTLGLLAGGAVMLGVIARRRKQNR